jgi:hypothetical protein
VRCGLGADELVRAGSPHWPSGWGAAGRYVWVTLTGDVRWGCERTSAEDAIRFLPGVKGVTDNIALQPNVRAAAASA